MRTSKNNELISKYSIYVFELNGKMKGLHTCIHIRVWQNLNDLDIIQYEKQELLLSFIEVFQIFFQYFDFLSNHPSLVYFRCKEIFQLFLNLEACCQNLSQEYSSIYLYPLSQLYDTDERQVVPVTVYFPLLISCGLGHVTTSQEGGGWFQTPLARHIISFSPTMLYPSLHLYEKKKSCYQTQSLL